MPEKTSCLMSSIINDEKMDTETQEKKIPNLTKVSKNLALKNLQLFREKFLYSTACLKYVNISQTF